MFCRYCLKPLVSEIVRSRHVANSPFCREAEARAIDHGGPSTEPQPTHTERMDYTPKATLVDSVLDQMPAFITDDITKVLDELLVSESGRLVPGVKGTTGWNDDSVDSALTEDGAVGEVGQAVAEENIIHNLGIAAEVSVHRLSVGLTLD